MQWMESIIITAGYTFNNSNNNKEGNKRGGGGSTAGERRKRCTGWMVSEQKETLCFIPCVDWDVSQALLHWIDGWMEWLDSGQEGKSNQTGNLKTLQSSLTDNRSRNGITRPVGSHYCHGQRICQSRDRLCSREVNVHCTGLRLLSSNMYNGIIGYCVYLFSMATWRVF